MSYQFSSLDDFLHRHSSEKINDVQRYEEWADDIQLTDAERRLYGDEPSFEEVYQLLLALLNGDEIAVREVLEAAGILLDHGVKVSAISRITLRQITNLLNSKKSEKERSDEYLIEGKLPHKIEPVYTPHVSKYGNRYEQYQGYGKSKF